MTETAEPETVLVIGGGIAGIQAALDAANAGARVCLVEKAATIGGKMSALDKNFPTLDCSVCIQSPKMSEVGLHPNIELLALAEIQSLEGEPGNFRAVIKQRPRYVTDACTRCGDCVSVCPVVLKSEFDVGMSARKAIHTPTEQSVPGAYVIDSDNCLNKPPNLLPCSRCMDACGPDAINFNMKPRIIERSAAAIIVASGFDILDASILSEFGYGTHPDVLTSMELERLLQASGPTLGEIIRPSDGRHPENVLFILCVGSRDQRYCKYCSRICCMYSIKEAYQLKDHGIKQVDVAYMDIRAFGKGFDEFYDRTRKSGVRFVRTRPAKVAPNGGNLCVTFEDTEASQDYLLPLSSASTSSPSSSSSSSALVSIADGHGESNSISHNNHHHYYDMVVLAPAIIPSRSTENLSKVLGIELAYDGYFESRDETGDFVTSTRDGIYLAGCATGPKDIPDSVLEAGAAVSKALTHVKHRSWPSAGQVTQLDSDPNEEARIGVFACHCGSNIAGTVNIEELLGFSRTLPGVVHVQDQKYSCAANTLNDITGVLKEKKINRMVVAACSPKTHYSTFQATLNRAGLNPYLLDMANVRNMDSWVHKEDKEGALLKAKDMVKMSVLKALNMKPLEVMKFPVTQKVAVIGGGVAGIVAATNLASQGFETHLIEKEEKLGGILNKLAKIEPLGLDAKEVLGMLIKDLTLSGANVHTNTKVENTTGFVGNYEIQLSDGELLKVGAIVLAIGAQPYTPTEFEYGKNPRIITSLELEEMSDRISQNRNVAIISCLGSRNATLGCSRFCCQTMIGQATKLREQGSNVTVLYRDLRSFARFGEEEYEKACRAGVTFVQYPQDSLPEQSVKLGDSGNELTVKDELIGREINIPADIVVLNVGLSAQKEAQKDGKEKGEESAGGIIKQLKVSTDQAGFVLESHPKLGPAEAMVQGVLVCGTAQYPKSVKESAIQALAAAAKASAIISRQEIEREPFVAVVDPQKCSKCARCIPVCPYGAIRGELGKGIEFITAMCQGCGTCVSECMVEGALKQEGFTDQQIMAQIDASLSEDPMKKVLIFACNWCSYAGADLAGVMKVQYPSNTRVIRTMCSGRVSQKVVLYAFAKGAGAVLVTGCHPGDCHYISGNQQTLKRVERWKHLLKTRGVNPDRLQLWWVSASEAKRFAEKAREMDELLRNLSTDELESTTTKIKVAPKAPSSGTSKRQE